MQAYLYFDEECGRKSYRSVGLCHSAEYFFFERWTISLPSGKSASTLKDSVCLPLIKSTPTWNPPVWSTLSRSVVSFVPGWYRVTYVVHVCDDFPAAGNVSFASFVVFPRAVWVIEGAGLFPNFGTVFTYLSVSRFVSKFLHRNLWTCWSISGIWILWYIFEMSPKNATWFVLKPNENTEQVIQQIGSLHPVFI